MEKRDNSWFPYKTNGCIEKNRQTSELRCVKCNKYLGINPGGASSHLKSRHKINLDGSPSIKVEKTIPKSAATPITPGPLVIHRSESNKMFDNIISHKPQMGVPKTRLYEPEYINRHDNLLTWAKPQKDWWKEYEEKQRKKREKNSIEIERQLEIAKKIKEMQDAGAISVDEAKIMRLNVGLMPNEQRGLTADDKKDLRKIALDTTRPATERIYAILMLSG